MEVISLKSWEEFEERRRTLKTPSKHEFARFLFRGQEDSSWELKTSLERWGYSGLKIKKYYRTIYDIKSEVESLSSQHLEIPSWEDALTKFKKFDLQIVQDGMRIPADTYMAYLRHHGFPSPFLDWTRSAYVAAYFAFRRPNAPQVAIFAYSEMPEGEKSTSNRPGIYPLNSNIGTHKRHFLQQSKYTICFENTDGLRFASHEAVFSEGLDDQDRLIKFILPSTERRKVLELLDQHNLNAFSLFASEEGLMEAMAIRRLGAR